MCPWFTEILCIITCSFQLTEAIPFWWMLKRHWKPFNNTSISMLIQLGHNDSCRFLWWWWEKDDYWPFNKGTVLIKESTQKLCHCCCKWHGDWEVIIVRINSTRLEKKILIKISIRHHYSVFWWIALSLSWSGLEKLVNKQQQLYSDLIHLQ